MQSSTIPFTSSFHTPTKKSFPYNFSPHNDSPNHTHPKSEIFQHDYGKAKGIEILSFKGSEVERTFSAQTSFVAAGTLHVLYFEAYDRFILCLNDWKYALLRRLPVISSDTRLQGPISYTLPTCDGFYTLRLVGVENLASLKNFETILANSSKFSYKEPVNNSSYKRIPTSSDYSDFEHATPNPLTKSDRWKRGFRKFNSRLSNSFKKSTKPNLNLYQTRDFESLKKTNEMMAPLHLLPKRDIDSLLSLSKAVASQYGFEPEPYSSGLQNCQITPISYRRDAHGAFTNPFASPSPTRGGITASPQPDMTGSIGKMSGNHAINAKNYGLSQPKLLDRIKAKLPGEHHYYGEKVPGEKQMTHSHGTLRPRRTVKEVLERNEAGTGNARNDESLIDSFTTEQEPYEVARSPKFGDISHGETLEVARQRSLELVQKYTNDYLAHKERMSRFSTQSKREEENNSIPSNSFGPDLETVDTSPAEKESNEVQIDSRSVGSREAKGLRKRVAMKIDYNETENILDLDSILRSEGFEQCEG